MATRPAGVLIMTGSVDVCGKGAVSPLAHGGPMTSETETVARQLLIMMPALRIYPSPAHLASSLISMHGPSATWSIDVSASDTRGGSNGGALAVMIVMKTISSARAG